MNLVGKTVLITGAAKRIGRQIALQLAREGCAILVHYRTSKKQAQSLCSEIHALGGEAFLTQVDFSSSRPRSFTQVLNKWVKELYRIVPQIDVLINNAAIFYRTPFESIRESDWDEYMDVNLKWPFFLSREIGLRMKKKKSGKIINLLDWVAERPRKDFLPYSVSKAGLAAATKGLAKILAPDVQVMGIAPGPILPAEHSSPAEQKMAAQRSLLKRFGAPSDIADAVVLALKCDFMTGSVIYVDGGASLAV
jgi:pteridine reductase